MVGEIGTTALNSLPSIDIGTGSSTSQQHQQGRNSGMGADTVNFSPEAQAQLNKLQQRDREVRTHEQSHIATGGSHVSGGASYTYQRGPDNKQYAVGGSVSIDTSPIPGDPEATKDKARQVRSAALAPSNPSAQDQSVAAQAASLESQARQEASTQAAEGPNNFSSSPQGAGRNLHAQPQNPSRAPDSAARAAAVYQNAQQQGLMPTQLVPWGTGIALTV